VSDDASATVYGIHRLNAGILLALIRSTSWRYFSTCSQETDLIVR